MNHFKISLQFGIFILKGIIIMRIGSDDLFNPIHIHDFNIHQGLHLEEHFVPARRATSPLSISSVPSTA